MSERTKKGLLHRTLAWLERNLWWILIGIAVAFIGTTVWFIWYPPQWLKDEHQNVELTKILLLALGGLGGLYGLALGARRTKNNQEQLFNERLGRGVELLAREEMTMRRSGIRVLWDLGKTSSQEQAELIVEIIHDFVNEKAEIKDNNNTTTSNNSADNQEQMPAKPRKKRLDIELGILAIAGLIETAGIKDYIIPFNKLDLRGLHFHYLVCRNANFSGVKSQKADFSHAKLYKVNFAKAELQSADFWSTELHDADFRHAKLNNAVFSSTKLYDAIFQDTELQEAEFVGAELHTATFRRANLMLTVFNSAELQEADFEYARMQSTNFCYSKLHRANFRNTKLRGVDFRGAELYGVDFSFADFSNAKNLTQEQIDTIIFRAESKFYEPQNLPIDADTGKQITVPKSRSYTGDVDKNGNYRQQFIKSDEPWSGQWVDEVISKEIAEAEKASP